MFGAITIPAEMPPGITLSDFALDADVAQQMMQVVSDNRRSARVARALGYEPLALYHHLIADGWAGNASDRMRNFRSAVKARTAVERTQAQMIVEVGEAMFVETPCNEWTCEDCERPLWHHIVVKGGATVCPFGRWYWTLARAILWDDIDLARMEIHARLAEIAR